MWNSGAMLSREFRCKYLSGIKELQKMQFMQYSRTSIIWISIIQISWLSRLFLQSQFCHENLLVMIKICSHIL